MMQSRLHWHPGYGEFCPTPELLTQAASQLAPHLCPHVLGSNGVLTIQHAPKDRQIKPLSLS